MKKLLLSFAAILAAASIRAQEPIWVSWANDWVRWDGGSPISLGVQNFQDEGGANLATRTVVNCIGAGITCADDGVSKTTITVPGATGAVATDTIWDAAGDLVVGTGADTAARLAKGTDGKVLTMTAGAVGWAALPAAAGSVLLQASSPGTPDVGNFNITGVGTSTHDAAGATLTPGFFLSNTTAAGAGAQQYSPSLKFCGQGWTTAAGGSSETDCWQMFARPIQGNPSSIDLVLQSSIAGAAYTQSMYMQSNGHLTLGNSGTTNGALSFLNDTSGSILFTPPAGQALGSKTITLPIATGTMALLENPTFTLFNVGNAATGPGSFNILEDSDNGSNYIQIIGQSDLAGNYIYTLPNLVGDGTIAVAPTAYPGLSRDPTKSLVIFDDFCARGINTSSPALFQVTGQAYGVGAGTGAGFIPSLSTNPVSDGKHPCTLSFTTGSTVSGAYGVFTGAISSSSGSADSMSLDGGEIFEAMVYVPVAADAGAGTDQWTLRAGFTDITTGIAATDGAQIYWTNSADTHWGCEAHDAGSDVATISTTVATDAAWHKLRVVLNSTSSVSYYVDGAELSCSPIVNAAKIPDGVGKGFVAGVSAVSLGTAGSCSSVTYANAGGCDITLDYMYLYDPLPSAR